ncbi:Protein-S-isoprenylcysteine O-methyltransferase Ste14 [Halobiforma haloterrestris]|uniref:Protein-S-isoprenylcysteine O-methyltransferase Ste14 n=1 Tax=Natronobacterium haloterrestre TaxID=148448 RepID=A0A1I1I795_NATHA|nr:isoprenylcysteine carboxylmethyltransferase family protein [Halobiforma haloterrestris]SFC30098.1 Protein-S-isoprenylcysteine O-methyltransferase Ste14 [Halobiforma haloterrestris]
MTATAVFADQGALAFLAAIGVWIASDLSIGLRYRNRTEKTGGQDQDRDQDQDQDRGSRHAIGGAVSGGVMIAVAIPYFLPGRAPALPAPAVTFWLGIGLVLLGVAVRQYAVRTLGAYFSLEVTVDRTDRVVSTGPYRWVRHPSYTGGLTSLLGAGLAVGNGASLAVLLVAGVLAYGYRIRVEERALRDRLGDDYTEYTDETPYRLVPFLW